MPRVRRLRREAPTLELLAATLPELKLGLSEDGARTLAYEVFEKLGYGAVAVTDTARVLAFVGAGADHHRPGARADTRLRRLLPLDAFPSGRVRVARGRARPRAQLPGARAGSLRPAARGRDRRDPGRAPRSAAALSRPAAGRERRQARQD